MAEHGVQGRAGGGPEVHGVEGAARLEGPGVRQVQRLGPGERGEVQQVGGAQGDAAGHQVLHEVRLQSLFQQGKAGAAAHVAAQRDVHAGVQVAAQREEAAAERGVAARAVRGGAAVRGHDAQFAVGRVDVVRQDRVAADQSGAFVGVEVVAGAGEQVAHGLDLAGVLVDVAGEAHAGEVAHQGGAGVQDALAGRQAEAGRDGVQGAARAVPAFDQGAALVVGALGRGVQFVPQQAVTDDQSGHGAQAGAGGLLEEGVHGAREVRAEHQRGGRPGADQAADEVAGHAARVGEVGHARLLRQGALVEPVEERQAQPADHAHLRVVDVRVDEARQQQAAAQVGDGCVRVRGPDVREGPGGADHAVLDEQAAVRLCVQRVRVREGVAGRVQVGGAVQGGGRGRGGHGVLSGAAGSVGRAGAA